jgi:3-hydroxyisobutyrate dehydrogenase-like beta-hydroxyacid dehydrogenase
VTIGIVSPGAMGSALGAALARGGARVIATLAGRSERTERLARAAGLELLPSLAAVVGEAEIVLSVAPPGEAEAIAGDIARAAGEAGGTPLVADLNAVSPSTMRSIAERLGALELVDGAISGPPPREGATTRIYLSGSRAAELAALSWPGVEPIVVGDEVGTASAVKMCTASVYKGTTALLTHALLTAHAHGVVSHVLDDLGRSLPALVDGAPRTLASAATKSERFVAEMREIAATQAAAGLTPDLFEAMAEVYAELSRTSLARTAPEDIDSQPTLEQVLEALRVS